MSGDGNEHNTGNKHPKQQGGSLLPFSDHGFKAYHTTEWYQWELNVQMLVKRCYTAKCSKQCGYKNESTPEQAAHGAW
eukprot:10452698-Ditylum_brightwellii.AAC.1